MFQKGAVASLFEASESIDVSQPRLPYVGIRIEVDWMTSYAPLPEPSAVAIFADPSVSANDVQLTLMPVNFSNWMQLLRVLLAARV